MMAAIRARALFWVLIPAAAVAGIIAVVLTGYARDLDRLIGDGPESAAAAGLPPILHRVADSLSAADLAGLLARQFVTADHTDLPSGFKRTGYALLMARKYEKESLLAFFFHRTPFPFPRKPPVRGFEGAARAYFGVPPGRMTAGEAILLFHIALSSDAPVPVSDPERAIELRNLLLLDLMKGGLISRARYRSESGRPLILSGSHPSVW